MVISILSQFVFPSRSCFEVWNSLGFLAVQVVAVAQHVVFFAPLVVFIRKIEFQILDRIFKLAQMEIRIA